HSVHMGVGTTAHAAHDVMGRRADLHGLTGDIDIAQLFELMVHAGQLAFDVILRSRNALLDPRAIQEDTAVGAAAALLDFTHDATCDMIPCQQFGRAAGVLVSLGIPPAFV